MRKRHRSRQKKMKSILANDRLRLSITNYCNFSCVYCSNEGQRKSNLSFIGIDFFEKLAEKIIEENIYIRKLNITGGEPLLHPQFFKIVKICTQISEAVTINTNGVLLNREIIKELKEIGINNIKFGIDSFFSNLTKPCIKREIKCNTDKIIDNLLFSIKIMPRSSVNIVLTNFNYGEIDQIINFIFKNKINWVELLELIQYDFLNNKQVPKPGVQFKDILKKYKSKFSEISYNHTLAKYICKTYDGLILQLAEDFCLRRVCQNLWTRIDATGSFVPCIKAQKGVKIDFSYRLKDQIIYCNKMMCNGPKKHIPRDYSGNLLLDQQLGDYIEPKSFADAEFEIITTYLDP